MMPMMMLIMNGITILIVWSGAHGVSDGQMQVGDMMAFIQYTMRIIMSFPYDLYDFYYASKEQLLQRDRVDEDPDKQDSDRRSENTRKNWKNPERRSNLTTYPSVIRGSRRLTS